MSNYSYNNNETFSEYSQLRLNLPLLTTTQIPKILLPALKLFSLSPLLDSIAMSRQSKYVYFAFIWAYPVGTGLPYANLHSKNN